MLVIFPFEESIYRNAGVPCAYVGHPLLDHVADYAPGRRFEGEPVIGLLPGSRAQEIARLMPLMAGLARGIRRQYAGARFIVPVVDEARAAQVRALSEGVPLEVVPGGMFDVLAQARFAVTASGTATLETALFGVPMVVVYKVSPITYGLARLLVDVKHIGMVNIIAGRGIVPEFIQGRASVNQVLPAALDLIGDTPSRARMLEDLGEVRERLGGQGASARAAAEILDFLEGRQHAG
jgi:lipid-A-disaccharide synthase